jgi:site-specific DNA recombinase
MFRNPVYCRLIANSLLDGQVVKRNHKTIVSKQLFLKVNNINEKNGDSYKHTKHNIHLPMKNFIKCGTSGKPITGYTKKIHYYRCNTKSCKSSKRADELNEKLKNLLSTFEIDQKFKAPLKLQKKN